MPKKITCVIIDDEPASREIIRQLLSVHFREIVILSEAATAGQGAECLSLLQPDLVFLDIQFPDGTAFDLLKKTGRVKGKIIFTTAYDHYAIQAIKASAANYLLKPIDPDEFYSSVSAVLELVDKSAEAALNFMMESILQKNHFSRIALPTQKGLLFTNISDIVYCAAMDNYTVFHLGNGQKITVSKTLREYEDLLSARNFFRVHHSYIVNMAYIKEYIKGRGGYLVLTTGQSIDVSQNRRAAFLKAWGC
jgi:two-component system, LytTR family, response regulator